MLATMSKREEERGNERKGHQKSLAMESQQIRPFQIKPATWPSNSPGGFMKTQQSLKSLADGILFACGDGGGNDSPCHDKV